MKKVIFLLTFLLVVIPCQAEIIYVDDDGLADFNSIQDAINYSWHGDTVLVKPGIYGENIYFNSRAITLTSENPHDPNVVDSTIILKSSGYTVTFDFGEGSDSVLTGFTIRGRGVHCYASSPTITKNTITECDNTGIYGKFDAAPTISYNTITNNSSYGLRGCHGLIIENTISDNTRGLYNCDGEIQDNEIIINSGTNKGAGLYGCDGVINNNTISWNTASGNSSVRGGGLCECSAIITHNIISHNLAYTNSGQGGEGGGLYNCEGQISNNIVVSNSAFSGAGLANCSGIIRNNTIVHNKADETNGRGGALYYCSTVVNNIIAFNESYYIGGVYGTCDNSYNVLWMNEGGNFGNGAVEGPGDICQDPLFADYDSSDYHLKSNSGRWDPNSQSWVQDDVNSPCIDAGEPNTDWTNELWPHGKRINMGAYGGTTEASMSLSNVGNKADFNNDGMVGFTDLKSLIDNWLRDQILLSADIDRDGIVNFTDFATFAGDWLWHE